MAKRRRFTDQHKAKGALEALRGDKKIQLNAAKHRLHPNKIGNRKRRAIEGMADVFARAGKPGANRCRDQRKTRQDREACRRE